jgi:hypothetical protein
MKKSYLPQASTLLTLSAFAFAAVSESRAGERLYNGIILPDGWPPRTEQLTREPMPVPYLASPPAVIPIDVGRQLFVDDFLIEHTTLTRTFHQAGYYPKNPVLKPDKSWEMATSSGGHPAPTGMVFSDGVWYDPQDNLFTGTSLMVDSSAVGGEGSVKHNDAPGRLVLEGQGQEVLRRDSLQSQRREVPKAEPLVVGRLAHENAPLGSPRLE